MKSSTFLLYFSKTLLGLALFCCLKSHAQGTITFSKPRNTMYYTKNGSTWNHIHNTAHTYNADGLETEAIATHPITNQNLYKKTSTYNSFGYLTEYKQYNWQNSTWEIMTSYRNMVTYTSASKIAQIINSDQGPNNTWINNFRYDYSYDSNQNLIEQTFFTWDIPTNAWLPFNREIYTYNANGIITQKQYFQYVNNAWNLDRTETFTAWHIPNSLPASYNTTLINRPDIRRNTITVSANGGNLNLTEMSFDAGVSWMNFIRHTELRDTHGNISTTKFETFNLQTNSWTVVQEDQNLRTYNSQSDITEMIVQQGGTNYQIPGPAIDRYKYVYSNFQYFTRASGTLENKKTVLSINVYPNPATDKIQIELADQKPQALTVTVKDITGKTWQTQTFKATEEKQLSIEALPKGIYLLQLQTEFGFAVKRIVKQ